MNKNFEQRISFEHRGSIQMFANSYEKVIPLLLLKSEVMYIYNVTINISEEAHDEWLHWMKTEHIPDMLDTGKFTKALMTKVLVEEETGGITYAIQYTTKSKETLAKYYRENADDLRKRSERFKGKYVAFRTELEIISEQ